LILKQLVPVSQICSERNVSQLAISPDFKPVVNHRECVWYNVSLGLPLQSIVANG
jgi:hypothetical protein